MYKSRSSWFFLWMTAFFGAACPLSLRARDITIIVLDQELGIPLEGAEIRSPDGKNYLGDREGRVLLPAPDDQPVMIRGSYPGYESERVVIEPGTDEYTLELRLTGTLEAEELVLEERRPREDEDTAVRNAAPELEIRHVEEPDPVEEPVSPPGQFPGSGYVGSFTTVPGIREGRPGDLMAVVDGFSIENPYHWGGDSSIFDPWLVERARLSHGVFSVRYGGTLSGLLDIALKKPSGDTEFELDLSTSAAGARFSLPIVDRGMVMFAGRFTYYDPVLWAARKISGVPGFGALEAAESLSSAPYIRSAALNSSYRFTENLKLGFTGFFGADGGAVELLGRRTNYQGFGFLALDYNFRHDMVLKANLGAVYLRSESHPGVERNVNVQGRVDYDWNLGRGFAAALGLQESYTMKEADLPLMEAEKTGLLTSSGYLLAEYESPARRLQGELGLRLDHLRDSVSSTGSRPAFSPRLNLVFNLVRDRNFVRSLSVSLGTGLFSAAPSTVLWAGDQAVKPEQSFTTQGGMNLELTGGLSIDIEGYYKYVFDRGYVFSDVLSSRRNLFFDGEGRVLGFDLVLKKTEGRLFGGWIAYSFSHIRYREPAAPDFPFNNISGTVSSDWYYPPFHRFHELNLVLTFRPTDRFTFTGRLGFSGGLGGRTPFSVPLDIKFSFFSFNPRGRGRWEFYAAVENVLSLIPGNAGSYGGADGNFPYRIPVPVPSIGFIWSY
jgi:hypothetical protein